MSVFARGMLQAAVTMQSFCVFYLIGANSVNAKVSEEMRCQSANPQEIRNKREVGNSAYGRKVAFVGNLPVFHGGSFVENMRPKHFAILCRTKTGAA